MGETDGETLKGDLVKALYFKEVVENPTN